MAVVLFETNQPCSRSKRLVLFGNTTIRNRWSESPGISSLSVSLPVIVNSYCVSITGVSWPKSTDVKVLPYYSPEIRSSWQQFFVFKFSWVARTTKILRYENYHTYGTYRPLLPIIDFVSCHSFLMLVMDLDLCTGIVIQLLLLICSCMFSQCYTTGNVEIKLSIYRIYHTTSRYKDINAC